MRQIPFTALFALLFTFSAFGQNYFQQEVNYTIDVKLNDRNHTLSATESIEYINNSPDDLTFLYFHIWPNAYKNINTALAKQLFNMGDLFFYYSDPEDRGYIDSLDFKVDGKTAKWEYDPEHIDICKITLNEPLKSGAKINITTPFYVKIPSGEISRLGHVGSSYQVTQWYPKPAVYDKDGWHPIPYLTQGEFYSEFGSYDVSITVPSNYVLAATGDMVDGEKELAWLNEKVAATKKGIANETIPALNKAGRPDNRFPPSADTEKTLRFKQSKVHDFAWFCDKRWHVLKGEVELPHSKNKVTTWAFFTNNEARLWKKSIEYLNDATFYYSKWNGDYPYKHVTAVDGTISAGGGMEYPNITVIGASGNDHQLEEVIMHEVGHNWFYGILGSNERTHAWMDEGLNSFNENRYNETKYPNIGLVENLTGVNSETLHKFRLNGLPNKLMFEIAYLLNARRNYDQPMEFHSADYTPTNYGGIVYSKSAIVFDYLMAYLGEEKFDACMQEYFETWKFKHPQPSDLQQIFEKATGKDLSWFFVDMIQTTKKLDYKILKQKGQTVTVKNTGHIKGPFSITGLRDGVEVSTKWYEGIDGKGEVTFPEGDYNQFRIDAQLEMPETNRLNNTLKTKGLFKKSEKLRLQFLGGIEDPTRNTLYYLPLVGINQNDNFMLGIGLYNDVFPQKKFGYALMPMFSTEMVAPVGGASIYYNIHPEGADKLFRQVKLSSGLKSYHHFFSSTPDGFITEERARFMAVPTEIEFDFKQKTPNNKRSHLLSLKSTWVGEFGETDYQEFSTAKTDRFTHFTNLTYNFRNSNALKPFGVTVDLEHGTDLRDTEENFLKASLEFNYRLGYNEAGKGIDIRFFAGKFFNNNTTSGQYNWRMDGQHGYHDYKYENVFIGRSAEIGNLWSQQMIDNHGAFKTPTANGQSNDWLTAVNIKAEMPFLLPLGFYADLGASPKTVNGEKEVQMLYNAGAFIKLFKGICDIYFPAFYSDEIKSEYDAIGGNYGERIRFTLHLHLLNPNKLKDGLGY
jgi:hypothetical protein